MKLACQEHILPGNDILEKWEFAASAGFDGIELHGRETWLGRLDDLDVLSKRGVLVCAGHGEGLSLDISRDLIAPERAVLGSEYFCYEEFCSNLELLRDNLPYLGQIITHRFAVQDIQEAFEIFLRQATGKVLVEH
jgi:threonine 3-dehydrogenase